jgi:hypothetical protein
VDVGVLVGVSVVVGVLVGVVVTEGVGVGVGVVVGVGGVAQGCTDSQEAQLPNAPSKLESVTGSNWCETYELAEAIIVVQPVNPIAGNSQYQLSPTFNPSEDV